jgi:hypothetical protein
VIARIAADAGFAGVGSYGIGSKAEPFEVVMAPQSGAGLRAAMGATLRCTNHVAAEPLNLGERTRRSTACASR